MKSCAETRRHGGLSFDAQALIAIVTSVVQAHRSIKEAVMVVKYEFLGEP